MRRSLVLVTIVLAFGAAACGSKLDDSSTPTLPSASGEPTTTAATTETGDPQPTFKPLEECAALNAFRLAEFGAGMAPEADRQQYVDAVNTAAAAVKEKAPDIAADIDPLVAAVNSLTSTGATTPEEKAAVDTANANIDQWWQDTCL